VFIGWFFVLDSYVILWKKEESVGVDNAAVGSSEGGGVELEEDMNGSEVGGEGVNTAKGERPAERWVFEKNLRKHVEDVSDLNWSPDGSFLISASIDNSAVLWDVKKVWRRVSNFDRFRIEMFCRIYNLFYRVRPFTNGQRRSTLASFTVSLTIH
jgi:WD40 repeat protein